MPDKEKVIKGFECCHVMVHNLGPEKSSCGICPYKDVQTEEQINLGGIECIAVLHDDALALLKEQEKKEIKLHKKHVITWKRDDEFTTRKLYEAVCETLLDEGELVIVRIDDHEKVDFTFYVTHEDT